MFKRIAGRFDVFPYTIKLSPEPQRTLLKQMWLRPRRKNNTFCTTTGNTGSGKSYGDIFFGYMLDVDSNDNHMFCEDDIIFDPIEFVERVQHPKRIGHFIMKDEIQLDAHSRDSFSKINRVIGDIMSTIRFKNEIIFLNLPSETQLDVQIRLLRWGNLDFKGVAPDGTYSTFSFEYLKYPKKADTKSTKEKAISRDSIILFDAESHDYISLTHYPESKLYLPMHKTDFVRLLKYYDVKKNEYLMEKFDKFKEELRFVIKGTNKTEFDLGESLDYIDKNRDLFIGTKKLDLVKIQKHFDVNISVARLIRAEFHNSFGQIKKEDKQERVDFVKSIQLPKAIRESVQ